jgi:long-chain acyl-CoA synthetase
MIPTGAHVPIRLVAGEATSIGDLLRRRARATPSVPAAYEKSGSVWEPLTWSGFYDRARRAARGLSALGVARGDRVAILGPTRTTWGVLDMAAQLVAAVSFGIYPQQTPDQIRYLLAHSQAKVVHVGSADEIDRVLEAARGLPSLRAIVPWDLAVVAAAKGKDDRLVSPEALEGEALEEAEIERRLAAVDGEDTAILVYTSGTTGPPKGAMIRHRNVLSALRAVGPMYGLFESDLSFSFLPMAHVAERILGFYGRVDAGMPAAYARGMGTVLADLAEVRPTVFGAVPRIFEKAHAKILAELERRPPAVRRLFAWAVDVGKRAAALEIAGRAVPPALAAQRALADRLVFRRVRAAFGGRVRYLVTGAAPLALPIVELFWAVGLPMYEMYGMTEATVVTHANRPGAVRLGTVGRVIPPMEARIAGDGEILLRGPFVFPGYLDRPEDTADAIRDGWLCTGDIGTVDDAGFLRVTDRKKHLIITAGGKNLAPANIENAIKAQDPIVSQVYVHGDRRPYVIALVAPSPLETLAWGRERGLLPAAEAEALSRALLADPSRRSPALDAAMAQVVAHPAFGERIRDAVRRGNAELAHVEQVRRIAVLPRDLGQEHGELTPTMKIKRKAVAEIHAALIDAVYEGGGIEV